MLQTDQMIEVTGVALEALVRAAYNPSRPQGLGALHYTPGDLTDEEVASIVDRGKKDSRCAISMDYVKGRSCKFTVFRGDGERLFIRNYWYDHSDYQLREMLTAIGIDPARLDAARKAQKDHEDACLDKAIKFLGEHGGTFVEPRSGFSEEHGDILTGLYVGQDRKKIVGDWKDSQQTWSIAA